MNILTNKKIIMFLLILWETTIFSMDNSQKNTSQNISIKKIERITYDNAFIPGLVWREANKIFSKHYNFKNNQEEYVAININTKKISSLDREIGEKVFNKDWETNKNKYFPDDESIYTIEVSLIDKKVIYVKPDLKDAFKNDIYIMDINRENAKILIKSEINDNKPLNNRQMLQQTIQGWSPKGRYFIYVVGSFSSTDRVYIYDIKTNNKFLLPKPENTEKFIYAAHTWSPDGLKIAFYVEGNKYERHDSYYGDIYILYLNIEY